MLTNAQIEEAAQRLLATRHALRDGPGRPLKSGLVASHALLPAMLVPPDEGTAYAIQDALIRAAGPVAGWKVAGSGPAGPSCAPVFHDCFHAGSASLPWAVSAETEFECEIAFEFGRDLPARAEPYSDGEVVAAIRATRVTIELLAPRFRTVGDASERCLGIAEGQACGGLIVGGRDDNGFLEVDCVRQPVQIEVDGVLVHDAIGGNTRTHLLPLLVWLANHLRGRASPLKAGQVVTTGSCTGKRRWDDARQVVVRFEGIGELAVSPSA